MHLPVSLLSLLFLCLTNLSLAYKAPEEQVAAFFNSNAQAQAASGSGHTNNWAVLVCASRYWFNYRVRSARL